MKEAERLVEQALGRRFVDVPWDVILNIALVSCQTLRDAGFLVDPMPSVPCRP